jgi:hypothetical protein
MRRAEAQIAVLRAHLPAPARTSLHSTSSTARAAHYMDGITTRPTAIFIVIFIFSLGEGDARFLMSELVPRRPLPLVRSLVTHPLHAARAEEPAPRVRVR